MNHRKQAFEMLRRANPVTTSGPAQNSITPIEPLLSVGRLATAAALVVLATGLLLWFGRTVPDTPDPVISPATSTSTPPTTDPEPALLVPPPTRFVLRDGTELATTSGPDVAISAEGYGPVIDRAIGELLANTDFGSTPEDRYQMLFGCPLAQAKCAEPLGGLTVTVTIEPKAQAHVSDVYANWLTEPAGPSGEIVVIDNNTGAVLAWVAPDKGVVEPRQAGSFNHVITTIAALEAGIGLESIWDTSSPREFEFADGSSFSCSNAAGGGSGSVPLYLTVFNSVNVPSCEIISLLGIDTIQEVAGRMFGGVDAPGPQYIDGAYGVTGLGVAQGFSAIANFGVGVQPQIVAGVVSPGGDARWVSSPIRVPALQPALAAAVHRPLMVVPVKGTAPRANIGRPQGGKTSTLTDFVGAWYAGYTPELTAVVWVGFSDGRPLTDVRIHGDMYSRVFGGSVPAPMWKEIVQPLLGRDTTNFPPDPEGTDRYFTSDR